MAKSNSRRNAGLLIAAPLMAAGLLAMAFAVLPWQERLVIDYWQEEIDRLPDDQVGAVLGELAQRGDLGIRILASQVGAEREEVSRAAYEVLRDAISDWREDALSQPLDHLCQIAQVLAASADQYGPAASDRAAAIAHQILLWMPTDGSTDRASLIAHCERIVQLAAAETGRLAASPTDEPGRGVRKLPLRTAGATTGGIQLPVDFSADHRVSSASHRVAALNHEPGPGLAEPPVPKTLEWPDSEPTGRRPDAAQVGVERGPFGPSSPGGVPAARVPDGNGGPPKAPRVLADPSGARPLPRSARSPAGGRNANSVVAAGLNSETEQALDDLTRLPVIRVMRLLHDRSPTTVADASAELHDRGLNGQQIDLAKDLTDSDPAVRRRLVDRLPATAGLVARPWLLWLSRDTDADVRLAALTFLATGTDPRLLDFVEQLAGRDQDPRIEALGTRLSQRH